MDWTAGLQAYNKSSSVVSRVSKTYNIMISLNITKIFMLLGLLYIIIHLILHRLIKHINNANQF